MAVTYAVPKTGYKAQGAYGSRPIFAGERCIAPSSSSWLRKYCALTEAKTFEPFRSTNDFYQKQVLAAGEGKAKKLEPYRPNAPRNRPKEMVRKFGVQKL